MNIILGCVIVVLAVSEVVFAITYMLLLKRLDALDETVLATQERNHKLVKRLVQGLTNEEALDLFNNPSGLDPDVRGNGSL